MLRNCKNPPTRTLIFYFLEKTASKGCLYNILGQVSGSGNKNALTDTSRSISSKISLSLSTAGGNPFYFPLMTDKAWGRQQMSMLFNMITASTNTTCSEKTRGSGSRIISFKMAAVSCKVVYT